MARKKKPGVRRHLHVSPYVFVKEENKSATFDGNARVDKALAWYDAQPAGKRQSIVWELLIAAVNGELGVAQTVSLVDEDSERTRKALDDMLKNMVLDEDE